MGTWGDGLYDNDHSLDVLGDLFKTLELEKSPAHLAVSLGVRLWMEPSGIGVRAEKYREIIRRRESWLRYLPAPAAEALREIAANPKAASEREGSRSDEVRQVVGSYNDGPRIDALLQVPGADAILQPLADRCMEKLDRVFKGKMDLYELAGEIAPLGVLLELRAVGIRVPPAKVETWRKGFSKSDQATKEERGFWDDYVERVKPGFDLLLT
jgi:hypothetical protein